MTWKNKSVCILLGLAVVGGRVASAAEPTIIPKVDPRVEMVSIVFRLAGSPEYSMSPLKKYTDDIDAYFSQHKEHPAVVLARKMAIERDLGFDAAMGMAVHLSPPPELKPLVAFSDQIPDVRYGKDNATAFAALLASFYRDTKFDRFFAAHRKFYELAEGRFHSALGGIDLNWYKGFYRTIPAGEYRLVLGLNNGGGNYGVRVVWPDGHDDRYSVIGCWSQDASGDPTFSDDYLPTIIHEFNHSFVNPAVLKHKEELASAEEIYKKVSDRMHAEAYFDSNTMVIESLVRAAVIQYLETRAIDKKAIRRQITQEQTTGFVWMDELVDLLQQYQAKRSRYPTFESFLPAVAEYYRSLALRISGVLRLFNEHSVHVAGVDPFPNGSMSVDPATKEIVISFDKAIDPQAGANNRGYSLTVGDEGEDHYPVSGSPEFLPGNRSIKIPVSLKPDWTYRVVLTPLAFAAPDGYPLERYTVSFKTKP
ncbi:MAG TPA: DUF4932 domain-containing protein [Chthoniobacterales bacterium]|nr:DUF4932 domain-containing protein [Chthoniobacterales bacterium]